MNQQEVHTKLLELNNDVDPFSLLFTGKKSTKVDGLYKPESAEILIHNLNFNSDEKLIYTAIHEFAHHIQFTKSKGTISSKSHTTLFWNLFHSLLFEAEKKGIYNSIFKRDDRFKVLTERIKNDFLGQNASLMKEFGNILLSAVDLCNETGASFEDYLDRELGIKRNEAKAIIKAFQYDVDSNIGYDQMKMVAGIKDEDMRRQAVTAFEKGMTEPMVKAEVINPDKYKLQSEDEYEILMKEKERLEKTISTMIEKLENVEVRLNEIGGEEQ